MNTKKKIIILLMLLPIVINAIALKFLPDTIPAHYDINGEVDRWGSKYEVLIYCLGSIVLGAFLLFMSIFLSKREKDGSNNEKICDITNIITLIFFIGMDIYFLFTAFQKVENLSKLSIGVEQFTFIFTGLSLIIIGNFLPKARRNSLLGLRTTWSLKNDYTWKKSQHFGGIALMISGFVMTIAAMLTTKIVCSVICLSLLAAATIISTIYTYYTATHQPREDFKDEKNNQSSDDN